MLTGASFPIAVKASGIPVNAEGFDAVERAAITIEYPGGQPVTLSVDAVVMDDAKDRRKMTSLDGESGRAEITPCETSGWKMSPGGQISSSPLLEAPNRKRPSVATRISRISSMQLRAGNPCVHRSAPLLVQP
jgi:hypothetical protein